MAAYTPVTNTLDYVLSLHPMSAFPLDDRTMFGSYETAAAAAAGAADAGSTDSRFYIGQQLTVVTADAVTHYSIQHDKTLKEVCAQVVVDGKTIVNDTSLKLKDFGVQYYAYKHADSILDGTGFSYPDNMPTNCAEGDFVQIGGVWYKYESTWVETAEVPSSVPTYTLTQGWKVGLEPKVVSDGLEFALAWYEPSDTTVDGLQSIVASVQTEIDALKGRTDEFDGRVTNTETAIETLNGDKTVEGSVDQKVAAAIAELVADAPESLDTLKEISDWISTHGDSAASMNTAIQNNAKAIQDLNTLLGQLPEGSAATTVIGYIDEQIKVEADRAKAAEEALQTAINGAVKTVTAGTNGRILVDGTEVIVYTAPVASTTQLGDVKVDGTTITATAEGVISVGEISVTKVTGVDDKINAAADKALEDSKTYANETFVAKTAVTTAAEAANLTEETASDEKVASEKALFEAVSWKFGM